MKKLSVALDPIGEIKIPRMYVYRRVNRTEESEETEKYGPMAFVPALRFFDSLEGSCIERWIEYEDGRRFNPMVVSDFASKCVGESSC